MCARDDTKLAPSSSSNFANSTFATASEGELRALVSSSGVSAEPRPLATKFSARWSRLTRDVLSASRGAPSSGARSTPQRQEPSKGRDGPCVEPALLLLPDGSVKIVPICPSQEAKTPSSSHSQTGSQTRTLTVGRKNTSNGARNPSFRVSTLTGVNSTPDDSCFGISLSGNSIPRGNHAPNRRATRVSDVLQEHPGCQVGSLNASTHGFLRPQHVLKPGHVYFLQPPLALPAPHNHGTPFSGRGDAGISAEIETISVTTAAPSDDSLSTLSAFSGPLSAFSASSGALSTLSEFSGSLSVLSACTAGVQDPEFLSPFPSSSFYHTPCAYCGDGGHPTTASATHSPHSLNHAHSLPPFISAATHTPSPSPLPPPSPSADSPRCSSRATRGHSRPGQKNTNSVPENPRQIDPAASAAAAYTFTSAAAQESCSSHLMHRCWCATSRCANLESWTGDLNKAGKHWFNCNSSAGAAADAKQNHQAFCEVLESVCSTPVRRFGRSNGSANSSISIRSSNSNISSISSSNQQMGQQFGGCYPAVEVQEKSRGHVPFRVRGRAVVTAEDMVFGGL